MIVTSNGTRELHDALKRRCLYHWIDYPSFEKELSIMLKKVPEVQHGLAQQVCALMQKIRTMDLLKSPGIAETLDWAQALVALNKELLDEETIEQTMGCIMKYREDMEKFRQLFKATTGACGGSSPVNLD